MSHLVHFVLVIAFFGILIIPTVSGQEATIPDWIKNNAGWWADGLIDDGSFVSGIQWLISNGIMNIPSTEQGGGDEENIIPSWIKNNAGWWADGLIDDSSFVSGIQYLIKSGIIVVIQAEKSVIETTVESSDYPDWLINNPSWQAAREFCNCPFDNFDLSYLKQEIIRNDEVREVNSYGFSGPEFSDDKPDNTYRIFAVGGSTTYGTGVKDVEAWPAFLQQKFDEIELDFNVQVINAGIPNANSNNEYQMISDRLVQYQPDLIIMYDGVNDSQKEGPSIDETVQNWKSVCKLGNEKGFETIIILQPGPGTGNRVLTDQEIFHMDNSYDVSPNLVKFDLYAERLVDLNEDCTKTADFQGIFDYIQRPIFFDNWHTGSLGNQIIAENVFSVISPLSTGKMYSVVHSDLHVAKNESEIGVIYAVGADLSGKNFDNLNLQNAVFDRADLSNTSFKNANIDGARFAFANLSNSNLLDRIDLSNINLVYADLSNANLKGKNLAGIDLRGVDLSEHDLTGTNLIGATLSDAKFSSTNLKGKNLSGAILRGVDLSEHDLTGANLSDAFLGRADLSEIDLRTVTLTNADFTYANLSGSKLSDSLLANNNLDYAILNNINFAGKDLSESSFKQISLEGSDMQNTNLSFASFLQVDFTKIKNKSLAGANFNGTSFAHSNLSGVNLAGVILDITNFWKADLSGIDFTVTDVVDGISFTDANLPNSNFEGVDLAPKAVYWNTFENKAHLINLDNDLIVEHLFAPDQNIFIISKEVSGNDLTLNYIFYNTFSNTKLQNANFKNADLRHTNFYLSKLTNANLSEADLRKSFFGEADLSGANLSGANLSGVILTNANLTGANLTGATYNENTILDCLGHSICVN
jgi:uncharacterized protein YjbI with pentapeptide repeats/lysophospholipase L1-like esterase